MSRCACRGPHIHRSPGSRRPWTSGEARAGTKAGMPAVATTWRTLRLLLLAVVLHFPAESLSQGAADTLKVAGCEDHSPFLTVDPTGCPVVVWIATTPDTAAGGLHDALVLATRDVTGCWHQEILDGPGDYYTPSVVFGPDGARWISWVEHDGEDSQVFCRRDTPEESRIFQLGDPEQPDLEPALCRGPDGGVVVGWQGWRTDNYEILLSVVNETGPGPPLVISESGLNDREPSLAWDGSRCWIVWSSYQGEPYNLVLRTYDGQTLSPSRQLTDSYRARNFHTHVVWDAASGLLWFGYIWINRGWNGFNNNEWPGLWDPGSPRLLATDGEQVYRPSGLDQYGRFPLVTMEQVGYERYDYGSNPMDDRYGSGIAVLPVPGGRIWYFYKSVGTLTEAGVLNRYWGCVGTSYGGGTWSEPADFFEPRSSLGWEAPAVAVSGDTLWVAWTADHRTPPIVSNYLNVFGKDLDVVVRGLPIDTASVGPPQLVDAVPVGIPSNAAMPPRTPFCIQDEGRQLYLLWGDNHRHSFDLSWDGDGDPLYKQTIFYSLDWLGHDYIAPSDHAERFSKAIWAWVRKWSRIYDVPGRFRVFPAYERSMRGGAGGDQNVMYRDPQEFCEASAGYPRVDSWHAMYQAQAGLAVLSVPHTPAECGAVMDWPHLAAGNPASLPAPLRLVEVYQSARQSFEYLGCPLQFTGCVCGPDEGWVSVALAMGLRLGLISASDHTIRAAFAGVYAEDWSREAIWQGLHDRRCFGTSRATKMNVEFRVGGAIMGSEVQSWEAPELFVHVEATEPLALIEINKDGQPDWCTRTASGCDMTFSVADPDPFIVGTSSFYYLRVRTVTERMCWTSPVWVDFVDFTGVPEDSPPVVVENLSLEAGENPGHGRVAFALQGLDPRGGCLRIYDVAGRLVRRLDVAGGGAQVVTWDGRGDGGRLAASGVYLAVLQSGYGIAHGRVTLVR